MSYDFYAEFWDERKLDDFIKKEMEKCWENIWEKSRKTENKGPKEFEEKITEILPSCIYKEFFLNNKKTYNFMIFLKILDQYLLEKEDFFNEFLSSLKKSYKGRGGKPIYSNPNFPKELVKSYYKIFMHDKKQYNAFAQQQIKLMESLNIKPKSSEIIDLSHLPSYSFFLSITFTLKKPFISKDDEEFYIHDNPVSKEKVFKVPYVRASSWKGNLRWIIRDIMGKRYIAKRLFGHEKGEKEEKSFRRGRLQFYPTFFNKIGLDIINPHDRKTRAGKNPITIETVPETATGTFSLLYVPFDLIGEDENRVKEVREDLGIISKAVCDMLAVYGFSAKKTSGYGVVNTDDSFKFELNDKKIKDLGLQPTSGDYEKFKELLNKVGVKG